MLTETGRRARNKIERRRRLEDAALRLFERDGFDATTIEAITAAAGLSPRTFFSYFATKDDVVLADYADRLGRIPGELAERPVDEHAWRALEQCFATVAGDYEAEADRIRRRFTIMATNPSVLARNLQLQLTHEVAVANALRDRPGASRSGPDPDLMAACAFGIIRTSVRQWLTSPDSAPLPRLVAVNFGRLADGLS